MSYAPGVEVLHGRAHNDQQEVSLVPVDYARLYDGRVLVRQ